MKSICVADLLKSISNESVDLPILVHCSYNTYDVRRVRIFDDKVILDVGEPDNPVTETDFYPEDIFDDIDYDSGPMLA